MLLKSIKIKGLLSFKDVELEMRPLSVLVGANASGKSNLIEIMALLQALPRDLAGFFRRSGGINDWFWKGTASEGKEHGHGELTLDSFSSRPEQDSPGRFRLSYKLGLSEMNQQPYLSYEQLLFLATEAVQPVGRTLFELRNGIGSLEATKWDVSDSEDFPQATQWLQQNNSGNIDSGDFVLTQSVIQQRREPNLYPFMAAMGNFLDQIRLYREWNMGRNSAIRHPQPTDAPTDHLYEDFSNLALVLNRLKRESVVSAIEEQLGRFYETYESLGVDIFANTAQLWIREKGLNNPVPAARLSDGTLRFLALLSILCHPNPPPLVCIEEPELGLHPDVIHQVAKLLIEASQRTQIIVTTHSSELIDHLWEDPESVVICERYPDTGTEFNRLNKDELKDWLERYELGELWRTGQVGGNRF